MPEQFLAALPVVVIRRDRCYDVPGCIVRQLCLPRPAGVHLILADPWSKRMGLTSHTGLSRAEIEAGLAFVGGLLARSLLQSCPAGELLR